MNQILFALLLFTPAGIANIAPIIANKIPIWNRWKTPIDLGKSVRGKRMLGKNKTWRGIITGVMSGGIVGLLVYPFIDSGYSGMMEFFIIGATLGFGALLGDAIESFFKRQKGIQSGDAWYGFDQLDYVFGSIIFSLLFIRLPPTSYLAVIGFYFIGHLVMTYIGYLLKLKDKPI